MTVAHFVIGLAALAIGLFCGVRREVVLARHQARADGHPVQAPAAYLVLGVVLVLVGVSQLVSAFV